jgi:hypothetical protein
VKSKEVRKMSEKSEPARSKEKLDRFIELWRNQIEKIEKQSVNEEHAENIRSDFETKRLILEIGLVECDEFFEALDNVESELKTALNLAVSRFKMSSSKKDGMEISQKKKILRIPISEETTNVTPQPCKLTTEDEKSVGFSVHGIGASYGQADRKEVEFLTDEDKKKTPKNANRI